MMDDSQGDCKVKKDIENKWTCRKKLCDDE